MDYKADILKMLEEQLQYHETETAKIKNAISAYNGDMGKIKPTTNFPTAHKKVSWTKEIEKIFESRDGLDADSIQKILIDNGVEQADDQRGRSAILTTLSRMKDKKLMQDNKGFYHKIKEKEKNEREEFDI